MFKKGNIPWNKGIECSEETKKKLSIAHKGRISPMKGKKHSQETIQKMSDAKKGYIPWIKGKKHSEKTKQKMSDAKSGYKHPMFGKYHTAEVKIKMSLAKKGKKHPEMANEKHFAWKGDNASYRAIHSWINRKLGKPIKCEHCGKMNLTGHQIHWANINHKYNRILSDYISLCPKCHGQYDKTNHLRKKKY